VLAAARFCGPASGNGLFCASNPIKGEEKAFFAEQNSRGLRMRGEEKVIFAERN
jgi:hypothetical protein